jgi:CheY-like chemotaxis protein
MLLVERDADVRAIIGEVLATEGYELIATPDARGALPLLMQHEGVGLILLSRPLWDDTEPKWLLNAIHGLPSLATVPIILIDVMSRSVLPGAQAVLRKPFSLETLLSAVETHCLKA